jgi:predicted nucleic acid-binding protein
VNVLIDTNIVVDVTQEREPFLRQSEQVMILAASGRLNAYISASTVSDVYYLTRRANGHEWTIDFLRNLFTFCQIATVDRSVIQQALDSDFSDFEDAIQWATALKHNCQAIVTRNPQDYPVETPQILTPEQLIAMLV